MSAGNVPLSCRLSPSIRYSSRMQLPRFAGRLPEKLLLKAAIPMSFLLTQRVSRSGPEKLLLDTSRLRSGECFPSSAGSSPLNQFVEYSDVSELREQPDARRNCAGEAIPVEKHQIQVPEFAEGFRNLSSELILRHVELNQVHRRDVARQLAGEGVCVQVDELKLLELPHPRRDRTGEIVRRHGEHAP